MRIAVISDTHTNLNWFDKMLPVFESVDAVIHLGDCVGDAKKLAEKLKCPVHYVAGNCDYMSGESRVLDIRLGGVKIFATHGHNYGVDRDIYTISAAAREKEAGLCLYGHTHIPDITTYYGIWFVNPGSISKPRGMSRPSYAIVEIDRRGEITAHIATLE